VKEAYGEEGHEAVEQREAQVRVVDAQEDGPVEMVERVRGVECS
jgi:hypothetical protein